MAAPFVVTLFQDRFGQSAEEYEVDLEELAELIGKIEERSKEALPLLKLAEFGEQASDRGAVRHDANLLRITGIEADYDGGFVSLAQATGLVRQSGIEALLHTSPSSTPEAPRWRVLCPVSKPLPGTERDHLVARLNGVLGGILAAESWVPSQAYYFGGITGQPPVLIEISSGRCIDECAALDATAIGRPWRNGAGPGGGSGGHTGADGHQGAGNGAVDEAALLAVIAAGDRYHDPCLRLAGWYAWQGIAAAEAERHLLAAFDRVAEELRDQRWWARRQDVPRLVGWVYAQETSKAGKAGAAADDDEVVPPLDRFRKYQNVAGRGLYYRKLDGTGHVVPVQLCNAEVWIEEEQIVDDGAGENRRYRVAGRLNRNGVQVQLPPAIVPVDRFENATRWIAEQWSAEVIVYPGAGTAMFGAAARYVSTPLKRRVYTHLGWARTSAGRWVYLHALGAIGAGGPEDGIAVELGGELAHFALPELQGLAAAVRTALGLLDLNTTVAAATWRAVLAEFCQINFSVFVAGQTGTLKSALCGAAQGFWGSHWDGVRFPASWRGTVNALEKLAFLVKDAVFGVDDFAPHGTRANVAKLHAVGEGLLRGVGNLAGRDRMAGDTSLRPTYVPRGLVLSSGEDVPSGQSLRARMVIEQIGNDSIDPQRLRQLQDAAAAGVLAEAMAGYVEWLAGQADAGTWRQALQERQAAWREQVPAGEHRRTPGMTASLMLGIDVFLEFAVVTGAVSETEAEGRSKAAWASLCAVAAAQAVEQQEEDPVRLYVEGIPAVLAAQQAHIEWAQHRDPGASILGTAAGSLPDFKLLGWRERMLRDGESALEPVGLCIGWYYAPEDVLWLLPDQSLAAVNRALRGQGRTIPISRKTLGDRLRQQGVLAKHSKESFTSPQRPAGQALVRVMVIARERFWPPETGES
jgi:hypothetical protein